ncbi:putative magnesium transporter MRS2-G [Dichanthelium oligosanthes]|uniref:Putative magnesium transporter MRS2-G n=1 Tax=Dichanthelium oligosanthes TaxID=888268 RepID=A0A1E5V749_9POAL|nr:putative magnesium transporter MRS2-G [Dichanthelium oligosanthes]
MGRRSGGRKLLPFCGGSHSSSSSSSPSPRRSRPARRRLLSPSPSPPPAAHSRPPPAPLAGAGAVSVKLGKKKAGARLWMRVDQWGASEVLELDTASVTRRAGVPPRDLRVLGPVFSRSSSILAREKSMVVSLESIRAIVTAEEVLLLDPLAHEVLPFIDQLKQRLRLHHPRPRSHGEEQQDELGSRGGGARAAVRVPGAGARARGRVLVDGRQRG